MDELLSVYNKTTDTHDSDWRTRENWKYGTSIGVAGTPWGFVNGVMLDSFPQSVQDWKDFISQLLSTQ